MAQAAGIWATVNFLFDLIKTAASGMAIYVFLFQRDKIKSVFSLLVNYAFQTTLAELYRKLDDLNDLTADDVKGKKEILNLFADIMGQVNGNEVLSAKCGPLCTKISGFIGKPGTLTEPQKRNVVSELRETLRTLAIENYHKTARR